MEEPFKKFFNFPHANMNGIVINTGGISQTEPNHIWGPGIRTYYLMHYVISGTGWYHVSKNQYRLKAGDLFLGYPNEVIYYGADIKNPWKYCWVGFSGLDIPGILKYTDFSKKNHIMHIEDPNVPDAIISLANCYGMSMVDYFSMLGHLNNLFALLIKYSKKEQPQAVRNIHLDRAVAYFDNCFSNSRMTIEDVAEYAEVSSNHLYRLFMEAFSLPPIKYLTQLRIREACKMIRDLPTSPISLIAYSVGYDDPLYFSKVFKKLTHVSPSEYRKNGAAKS